LPEGYTFTASGYARRGFFEMFAICVINMIIIAVVNIITKRVNGKIPVPVKALSSFIMLFTVLILITAMQKMKLNIEIFGMSKNRLLVSVFMLMIFVIIAFYILHIFKPKISYMQPIIVVCSVMFIALSYSNIDAYIVKYNVNAYNEGRIESLDVDYINNLSSSSFEYVLELADCDDHIVSKNAKTIIAQKIVDDYYDVYNLTFSNQFDKNLTYSGADDFRSYNCAKEKSKKLLVDYYNSLSKDDREKLYTQYDFDNGNYYYVEETDVYQQYEEGNCYEYSYNKDTDMYEHSKTYTDAYYEDDLDY
jgi:hypothetical protein